MRLLLIVYSLSLACFSFAPSISMASLGNHRDQIDSERGKLQNATDLQSADGEQYSVITMQSPVYTITQYANKDGIVFAVKWQGKIRPDLRVLLGSHFDEYTAAHKGTEKKPGHQPLKVSTSKIKVHHSGHMGYLTGFAYQPEHVPAGVNPETLP